MNEKFFSASYFIDSDKVVIVYDNKKVMMVRNISENYDIKGKSGAEISDMVLTHNRSIAKGVVEDYLEGL